MQHLTSVIRVLYLHFAVFCVANVKQAVYSDNQPNGHEATGHRVPARIIQATATTPGHHKKNNCEYAKRMPKHEL